MNKFSHVAVLPHPIDLCHSKLNSEKRNVKEHTSKFLKLVAHVFLAFPITYLIYVAVLFDLTFARCVKTFFSPSYWILSAIGIMVGYGFKEMTRWSWNLFLFCSLLMTYANSLFAIRYSTSNNKLLAFTVSVVLLVGLIYRLGREIKVPYFLPQIRWWESNPRYKFVVLAQVERSQSGFEGEILDVSMGGCFVKTRMDLTQDERILIRYNIFGETLEIGGTVVWRTQSSVTHPKGVGIKFDELNKHQKRVMKAATQHLKKISSAQNARQRMGQEEFSKRMETLKAHQLNISEKPNERVS